jgi:hypothetical protein
MPGVLGVLLAARRLFVRARAGAFGVDTNRLPDIPVPPRAVVEHGVAKSHRLVLADGGEVQ